MNPPIQHIKVFIAYAFEDKPIFDALKKHLQVLPNIEQWEDGNALAGLPMPQQIQEKLQETNALIPLVSSNLITTDNFSLVQHHIRTNPDLQLIPILAHAYPWQQNSILKGREILPRSGKAIESAQEKTSHEVYTEITQELAALFKPEECKIHIFYCQLNQPIENPQPAQPITQSPPIRTPNKRKKWAIFTLIGTLFTTLALIAGLYADLPPMFTDIKNLLFGADSTQVKAIKQKTFNYTPLFEEVDSTHFNILVIRFEDYIAEKNTNCIGRSIKEHLEVMNVNSHFSLPLQIKYVKDSIPPPENKEEALKIQKRHFADLIIYGLARNIEDNCAGADVCFRYAIADKVVANVSDQKEINTFKHDSKYESTSPMDIEDGRLKIDSLSMQTWVSALVNFKDNKTEFGLEDLVDLIPDDVSHLTKEEISKKYLDRALIYVMLGKYEKALEDCNKAIEINPKSHEAYNARGSVYRMLEQNQKAIEDYTQAISINSNAIEPYLNRANLYMYNENYKKAITDYTKLIELKSNQSIYYYKRGVGYYAIDKYAKAISDFTKAINLIPDSVKNAETITLNSLLSQPIINIIKMTKEKEFELAFEKIKNHYLGLHVYRGASYYHINAYEKAINDYTELINSFPETSVFYTLRAIVYCDAGYHRKAIVDLTQSIQLNPIDIEVYTLRAESYYETGEYMAGITDCKKIISMDMNNEIAYFTLGNIYTELKKYDEAIKNYTIAIRLNSNEIYYLMNRANTYSKLKKYKEALKDYNKVIELAPNSNEAKIIRNTLYEKSTINSNQ